MKTLFTGNSLKKNIHLFALQFLDRGVEAIGRLIAYQLNRKRITEAQAKQLHSLLKPSLHYNDLRDVDIVIEAVFENMNIKKEIFKKLDAVCKPSAILASNTSNLDIDQVRMFFIMFAVFLLILFSNG